MSLVVRQCAVADILQAPNIDLIAEEYAIESSIKGMPHPVGKMGMYYQLEALGVLRAFGAFVDDLPVGFITVLSTTMPHYGVYLSVSESFFVMKAHRKTGAGLRLLRMAEDCARDIGAPGLLVSAPYGGVLADVLPHTGYAPSNTVFFKGFRDV